MPGSMTMSLLSLLAACLSFTLTLAAPYKRNPFVPLQRTKDNNVIFQLGDVNYVANTKYPKVSLAAETSHQAAITDLPVAVIYTNASIITRDVLETTVQSYVDGDDVFTQDRKSVV